MPLMFLNGTGMSGQATHWIVGDSPLVTTTSTAPRYRFHAVGGAYPALEDVGEGGSSIVGEVYDVSYQQFREVLLPAEIRRSSHRYLALSAPGNLLLSDLQGQLAHVLHVPT